MGKSKAKTRTVYRSSITGKFISRKETEKKPRTTEKQQVKARK